MNIRVSHRIIGGFTSVIILLFVLGLSSLSNLNSIGEHSHEVSVKAVPALLSGYEMRLGLTQLEKFILNLQDAKTVEDVRDVSGHIQQELDQLTSRINLLQVKNDEYVVDNIKVLELLLSEYSSVTEQLQLKQLQLVKLTQIVEGDIETVEEIADELSSLAMDFADDDEIITNSIYESAIPELDKIDNYQSNLLEVITALSQADNLSLLTSISSEIEVQASLIKQAFEAALFEGETKLEHEILDDIGGNLEQLSNRIFKGKGLIARKREQLNTISLLVNLHSESSQKSRTLESELQIFIKLVENNSELITSQVDEAINSAELSSSVLMLVSVVLCVFISFVSVKAITVPLAKINDLLHSASSGDLRNKLQVIRNDEFGELAANVNRLIDNLKQVIAEISDSTGVLSAATDKTLLSIKETNGAVESQKHQIDMAAAATNEMSSTSSGVADNAEATLNQINLANVRAEKIKDIYRQNLDSVIQLAAEIETTSEVINSLNEDTASIGDILEVIRGIAEQTNLLALNAAIEAARAGEQGRGFAVVADEVRTLASRTQDSTQKIDNMINALLHGAEQAVAAMDSGREQAKLSVEKTEQANSELIGMTEFVKQAYAASVEIEQSAQEQSTVSGDISHTLEKIVMSSEQTSKNAQNTSKANAEVVALTSQLQRSISNFQL